MDTSLWSPRPQAKKSAPNYVIEQIRQALLEKKIKPGDRMPPESDLVELFGVSRGSIRQAMKSLETLGVITIRPGDGTYVNTSISPNNINPLVFSLLISNPSAKAITDARYALERDIIELILSDEHLIHEVSPLLEANIDYHEQLLQSKAPLQALVANDQAFHHILSKGCGNLIIQTVYDYVLESFEAHMLYTTSQQTLKNASTTLRDHKAILAALTNRDFDEAKAAIKNSIQSWSGFLDENEL